MESKFKGTPGPWFVSENGYYSDIKIGEEDFSQNIASCQTNQYTTPPITREIERYNAKLIAAAPELLDALIKLCDFADSGINRGDWGLSSEDVPEYENALLVISKALGDGK